MARGAGAEGGGVTWARVKLHRSDVAFWSGVGCIGVGCWLWSPALAFVVIGCVLVFVAWLLTRGTDGAPRRPDSSGV